MRHGTVAGSIPALLALLLAASATADAGALRPLAPAAALTRAATGHYVSPVTVNGGGPFDFVVDTGAESCAVYRDFADARGLPDAGYVAIAARHLDSTLLAFPVTINGVTGTAVLDSGARRSVINRKFAAAAGVDLQSLQPDAPLYGATGVEQEMRHGHLGTLELGERAWSDLSGTVADLAVFEAFGVADEPAMILGLDFLASGAMLVDFPAMMVCITRP